MLHPSVTGMPIPFDQLFVLNLAVDRQLCVLLESLGYSIVHFSRCNLKPQDIGGMAQALQSSKYLIALSTPYTPNM